MRAIVPALAVLALSCGDTLVDHTSTEYFDTTCAPPNHVCAGACVQEDAASCGDSCQFCTDAPAGAVPACIAHACDFECTGGRLREGGECVGVLAAAAGLDHTCAVTEAGTVKCWGSNASGQLGTGSGPADAVLPASVASISGGATAISAGSAHTCAVVGAAGEVLCWGSNAAGQIGDGTTVDRLTPVAIPLPGQAASVAAGEFHTCALLVDGTAQCWGANGFGQLGSGTPSNTPRLEPGPVLSLSAARSIAAGANHTCSIVDPGGALVCWGKDSDGQIGNGDAPRVSAEPTPVVVVTEAGPALASTVAIAGGERHTCAAVGSAGNEELWCWGSNTLGQGGFEVGTFYYSAKPSDVSTRPIAIAAGRSHTCALEEGAVGLQCFGANASGQLGAPNPASGPPLDRNDVVFASSAVPERIVAGGNHTCAILLDGTLSPPHRVLWCWGANARGELGDGTKVQRAAPAPVSGR
jgi:alpha-tubulin suppressor-like RCC1 family protein